METDAQRMLLKAEVYAQRARRHAYLAITWAVVAIGVSLVALAAAIVSAIQ